MTTDDNQAVPDYATMLGLEGRSFVVLGAGNGMGRQTTHALAQCGAQVLCVDILRERAHEVAEEVGGIPFVADISTREGSQAAFDAAEAAFGRLHGLVDIVGIARWANLLDIDDETWDFELDQCLRHAFLAIQIGGRKLRDSGGGAMAFVASISGIQSASNHGAYGAAKAGLINLVKTAAVELGPLGIRVNAVAPGVTLTPRIAAMLEETGERATTEAKIPTGRLNTTSDIAQALLFMVSDLASNISGQTLTVDGAITSHNTFQ